MMLEEKSVCFQNAALLEVSAPPAEGWLEDANGMLT